MPQEFQPNLTPDEAAAALAFATELSEGLMPQNPMGSEMPQGEGNTKKPSNTSDTEETMQEEPDNEQLEEIKEEIASLREEIQQALKEDDKEEPEKEDAE